MENKFYFNFGEIIFPRIPIRKIPSKNCFWKNRFRRITFETLLSKNVQNTYYKITNKIDEFFAILKKFKKVIYFRFSRRIPFQRIALSNNCFGRIVFEELLSKNCFRKMFPIPITRSQTN